MLSQIRNFFRPNPSIHQIASLEERLEARIQVLNEKLEELGETNAASVKSMRRMHLSLDHYGKLLKEVQNAVSAIEAKTTQTSQEKDAGQIQMSSSDFLYLLDQQL